MKKKGILLFLGISSLLLSGCNSNENNGGNSNPPSQNEGENEGNENEGSEEEVPEGDEVVDEGGNEGDVNPDEPVASPSENSAMVVYFSATGHTEEVANMIASYINAPIHELVPVDPYTSEDLRYSDPNSRVSQERNDPDHITELVDVDFEEFDDSHCIFLGAPVWWGELSYVIKDFVLSNDFTDKAIIPFATAASSNFSVSDLTYLSEEATWMEGRRFRQNEISEENVTNWIDSLNISFNN